MIIVKLRLVTASMNKEPIIFIFQFYEIYQFWEEPIGKVLN